MNQLQKYITVAFCLLLSVLANAQAIPVSSAIGSYTNSSQVLPEAPDGGVFIPIAKYFGQGDVDNLAAWMASDMDMSIGSSDGVFSKTQAKEILRTFFQSYKPSSFKIIHTTSQGLRKYALCEMTSGGLVFNVSLCGLVTDGQFLLQNIVVKKRTER